MSFPFIYFGNNVASRILFKDKERKWDEIENKLQAEHESLLLKSSNKVMNLNFLHVSSAASFKPRQIGCS